MAEADALAAEAEAAGQKSIHGLIDGVRAGERIGSSLTNAAADHVIPASVDGPTPKRAGSDAALSASAAVDWRRVNAALRFSELVHMLESRGFRLLKEKGSIRYYRRPGHEQLIRVDYHGAKEVPTGTCQAILKAAGIKPGGNND